MARKTALFVSAALTALVVGALALFALLPGARVPSVAEAAVQASDPSSTLPVDRERAYQDRLLQANAQLTEAYDAIQRLEAQNRQLLDREQQYRRLLEEANSARSTGQTAASSGTGALISREDAARVALAYVGGGFVREVELERKGGTTVYEVKTGNAEVVVDANSGKVLRASGGRKGRPEREDEGREGDNG